MDLRPYQLQLIKDVDTALEKHRAVCAVLPTGGGKTVCFSSMAQAISSQGASVWALAHREELVDQMSGKFLDFNVSHGLIKSGLNISPLPIQVGMIQTTKNKLHRLKPPDFLIIDECHHTPASQYAAIISAMPPATRIIGFTATPVRLDGKGLNTYYSDMVVGPSMSDLISMGFLCPPKVFSPELVDTSDLHVKYGEFDQKEVAELFERPAIIGDCIQYWTELAKGLSTVAFAPSILEASKFAARFNDAGIPAACVHGRLGRDEIKRLFRRFREREILVLFSVALIDEGFDCPGIHAVIDLAPSQSLGRVLQRYGRALRIEDGKERAIIIDHVGNVRYRHGLPTAPREWTLEGLTRRTRASDPDDITLQTCSVCFLVFTGKMCPDCKVEQLGGGGRKLQERAGALAEVIEGDLRKWLNREEKVRLEEIVAAGGRKPELEEFAITCGVGFDVIRNVLVRNAQTLDDLQAVGRALGYAPGWAQHRFDGGKGHDDEGQLRITV